MGGVQQRIKPGRVSAHTYATKHARQQRQTEARRVKEKNRRECNKREQRRRK